jgi:3-oxoadipate enol-lactonase
LACEALGAANLLSVTPRIIAPTLVICGADESQAFRDAATWLHTNVAGSRLEFIPSAAHASMLEQPVRIEALLRIFL